MNKTEKLKSAYRELKNGNIIMFIPDDNRTPVKCFIGHSSNPNNKRKYIFWESSGSSANKLGIDNLRWIAKTIGHCTSYDYQIIG